MNTLKMGSAGHASRIQKALAIFLLTPGRSIRVLPWSEHATPKNKRRDRRRYSQSCLRCEVTVSPGGH